MQFARRPEPPADPAAISGSTPFPGHEKIGKEHASAGSAGGIGRDGPGLLLQTARRREGEGCRFRRPGRRSGRAFSRAGAARGFGLEPQRSRVILRDRELISHVPRVGIEEKERRHRDHQARGGRQERLRDSGSEERGSADSRPECVAWALNVD